MLTWGWVHLRFDSEICVRLETLNQVVVRGFQKLFQVRGIGFKIMKQAVVRSPELHQARGIGLKMME